MTTMSIEIKQISNTYLFKYIRENINSKQFDEVEKISPLVRVLVSELDYDEVAGLFADILSEKKSKK